MRWDSQKRRYVDSDGHILRPSQVRKEVINYIEGEQDRAKREAEKLLTGTISLSAFFQFMRSRVEAWHLVAGSIAYGGKSQIDAERGARIAARIKSEKAFLGNFRDEAERSFAAAKQIASQVADSIEQPVKSLGKKLDKEKKAKVRRAVTQAMIQASPAQARKVARTTAAEVLEDDLIAASIEVDESLVAKLIGGTIVNRTGLYAEAAYGTFQNNVMAREFDSGVRLGRRVCLDDPASCEECVEAATEEFIPLDELAEIGSLQCMNNCRCEFEFSIEGVEFATSDVFQGVIEGQDAYGGSVTIN